MTEAIKQWIESEAVSAYDYQPQEQDIFAAGLTKGIEIAEGFAEWRDRAKRKEQHYYWRCGLKMEFTTSQLLEKYLKTLEP